jgi:glycosyltransferase involved in cell wall biosynthesis
MARVARQCEIVVVAPVAWFPFNRLLRGRDTAMIPAYELQDNLPVYHPKFVSIPGILKCFDGLFYFLSILPLIWHIRRNFQFDLIDVHFAYPDGIAGCLLAKLFRCPVTVTLRGTIGKLSQFLLRRLQIQWVLQAASRIFTVSKSLGDIAISLGADSEKVQVIPNGVDTGLFCISDRDQARRGLGLPLDRKIILSVGALSERKGHHRIVEVLPRIVAQRPDVEYVVVGEGGVEGDIGPILRQLSKDLGVQDRVHLVGGRSHDEIGHWLAAADVFCLATSNEGMANVILEALASGIPVVATHVGGNAELIENGTNGYLVQLGDQEALARELLSALELKWNRTKISDPMRLRSWDATAVQIVKAFDAICSKQHRNHLVKESL